MNRKIARPGLLALLCVLGFPAEPRHLSGLLACDRLSRAANMRDHFTGRVLLRSPGNSGTGPRQHRDKRELGDPLRFDTDLLTFPEHYRRLARERGCLRNHARFPGLARYVIG